MIRIHANCTMFPAAAWCGRQEERAPRADSCGAASVVSAGCGGIGEAGRIRVRRGGWGAGAGEGPKGGVSAERGGGSEGGAKDRREGSGGSGGGIE